MRTQRWTLAVVCAATAMLMLDIAVVNTALLAIADGPGHRSVRPAVGGRRLHARARLRRPIAGSLADRLGRRRLFADRPRHLHRLVAGLCRRRRHRRAQRRRAVQGVGAAIMFAVP